MQVIDELSTLPRPLNTFAENPTNVLQLHIQLSFGHALNQPETTELTCLNSPVASISFWKLSANSNPFLHSMIL